MSTTLLAVSAMVSGSPPTQQVIIFSSDAIRVATDAATEWNRGPLPSNAAFDIPDNPTKLQGGYFPVNYLIGIDPRMRIWINLTTGQVVEPDRCLYFHSRKIRAFSRSIRRLTGAHPIPLSHLAGDVGCDSLKPD